MVFDITQLGTELIDPIVVLGNSLIVNLPGIIAALLIIILGYIVGSVVGLVVRKIVEKVKVDEWLKSQEEVTLLEKRNFQRYQVN